MGTPRRTVPSLSKQEGSLRGELAAGIGDGGTPQLARTMQQRAKKGNVLEKKSSEKGLMAQSGRQACAAFDPAPATPDLGFFGASGGVHATPLIGRS